MSKKSFVWVMGAACVVCIGWVATWIPGFLGGPSRTQIIQAGQSFSIPVSEVNGIPQFYPLEVAGTKMEVIAIKDSAGKVRTAFNTCQSCYASGKGYYEAEGDKLVCQNCGVQFSAEQVGVMAGGCNPVPIFEEDKTVKNGMIYISYDYLKKATGLFQNQKR